MNSALDQFERQLVAASHQLSTQNATVAAGATTTGPVRAQSRRADTRRRTLPQRLLVALAAMIVAAGGVAAASSMLWPSQRLADGTVNCFMATQGTGTLNDRTLAVSGIRPNGQLPISLCRGWYRSNHYRLNGSTTGPQVSSLPLIACQETPTTVGVYVASGQPNQCIELGEKPLPATYPQAAARLRELQHSLLAMQNEHDCVSPAALASEARAVLTGQGFTGWRVITPPPDPGKHWLYGYALPAGTGGTCGTLRLGNPPTSGIDIDTHRQTITIGIGPPTSIIKTVNHIYYELYSTTYQRCFTAQSVRALVRRAFASTPLQPRFATVAWRQGTHYQPHSEHLYDAGCVRFEAGITGNSNHFIDILLNARHAPPLAAGEVYPPASAFRP